MSIQFTTDGSVTRGGFAGTYTCGPPDVTAGPSCEDVLEELSGPGACADAIASGYTCAQVMLFACCGLLAAASPMC